MTGQCKPSEVYVGVDFAMGDSQSTVYVIPDHAVVKRHPLGTEITCGRETIIAKHGDIVLSQSSLKNASKWEAKDE